VTRAGSQHPVCHLCIGSGAARHDAAEHESVVHAALRNSPSPDLESTVAFLASNEARYITGQTPSRSGDMTLG
jgi:NAD(P)-dependent dehydrogenase (short-subunit alcohol dehydrogenase family)